MIETRHITHVDTLLRWREEVLRCVFGLAPDYDFSALREANRCYYLRHADDHHALVALLDGEEAGCGDVCFQSELPSPDNPSGVCAYLMNIYTRPEFRSRGVAHTVVQALIEEARRRNAGKIYLEPSDCGRPMYLSMGFHPIDHMQLFTAS